MASWNRAGTPLADAPTRSASAINRSGSMAGSRITFSKASWWSRIFSDDDEKNEVLQMAYQQAEKRLKEAAITSGIYQSTNENVVSMLKLLLEQITEKKLYFNTTIPPIDLSIGS